MKKWVQKICDFIGHRVREWEINRSTSPQKLATMNALNRRKNTRIRYSHIGAVGDLPKIYFEGDEMIVGNISTGGLLLIDDTEALGHSVGSIVEFKLQWPDTTVTSKVRVVAAQLQRRHIQFVDFNANAFVRISKLIKPGFLGSRFYKVKDQHSMLDAKELWVGPTNESISFPRNQEKIIAFINIHQRTLIIERDIKPYWKETSRAIEHSVLGETIVMLANIPDPSVLIKDLIERLQLYYEATAIKATGTDD